MNASIWISRQPPSRHGTAVSDPLLHKHNTTAAVLQYFTALCGVWVWVSSWAATLLDNKKDAGSNNGRTTNNDGGKVQYAGKVIWETCFPNDKNSNNPLTGLQDALSFYKSLDVALISGTQLDDNRVQLQWQISVVWPIFWEPRVLLTGFSELTLAAPSSSGTGNFDQSTSWSFWLETVVIIKPVCLLLVLRR